MFTPVALRIRMYVCPYVALQSAALIIPMMIHNQYYTAKLEGTHVMIWPTHFERDDRSTSVGKDTRCGHLFLFVRIRVSESPHAETALFLRSRARAKKTQPTPTKAHVRVPSSRVWVVAATARRFSLPAGASSSVPIGSSPPRACAADRIPGKRALKFKKRNRSTVLMANTQRRLFREMLLTTG